MTHNRIRDASPLPPTCDQTSTKFIYPTLGKYAVAPWRLEAISSDCGLNSGLFANPSGNRQLSCSCFRRTAFLRKHRVKTVVPILVQVQRERNRTNHLLLDPPRLAALQPRDSRISFEPIGQCLLTSSERHSPATSDAPEFNAQTLRQKAA